MGIGERIPRRDSYLQTSGKAVYVDDVLLPGMLYGAVLRSTKAHARLLRVDISGALRAPGVVAGITAKDFRVNRYGPTHKDEPVLADDKVRHVGQAIAAVAAETPEAAEKALSDIEVEMEELEPVLDPIAAMMPGAVKVHEKGNIAYVTRLERGDVKEGFRASSVVVEDSFKTPMVEHCHIEPHATLAQVLDDGTLKVWSSVQRPFIVASDLSQILGVPLGDVSVVTVSVGGGFGGKNETTIEPLAAMLALKSRRPVKMVFSRYDEMVASTVRHAYHIKIRSGLSEAGDILAREVEIVSDAGAYVNWGARTLDKACTCAAGPYRIPNVKVVGTLVYTTKNVGGAMRGFGVPQVCFACEVHTDHICRVLGVDPLSFRRKNCVGPGDVTLTGQRLEVVALPEILRRIELMTNGGMPL